MKQENVVEKIIDCYNDNKTLTEMEKECKIDCYMIFCIIANLIKLSSSSEKQKAYIKNYDCETEQEKNKKKMYQIENEKGTLKELCERFNRNYDRVRSRIRRGYSIEEAFKK